MKRVACGEGQPERPAGKGQPETGQPETCCGSMIYCDIISSLKKEHGLEPVQESSRSIDGVIQGRST
jgi:hypothetical protein